MGNTDKIMLRTLALFCVLAIAAGIDNCVWDSSSSTCGVGDVTSLCGCSESDWNACASATSSDDCNQDCASAVAVGLACGLASTGGESGCTSVDLSAIECAASSVGVMIVTLAAAITLSSCELARVPPSQMW